MPVLFFSSSDVRLKIVCPAPVSHLGHDRFALLAISNEQDGTVIQWFHRFLLVILARIWPDGSREKAPVSWFPSLFSTSCGGRVFQGQWYCSFQFGAKLDTHPLRVCACVCWRLLIPNGDSLDLYLSLLPVYWIKTITWTLQLQSIRISKQIDCKSWFRG